MASPIASTEAGWPRPFWPSTSAVAMSSRATVGSASGWMKPARVHSTYLGNIPMPWESTPRRSVRTMSSAAMAAFFGDILSASSTATMYAVSAGAVTVTGASAMSGPRSGKPGGLHARELKLVAPVDRGEDRGDALERSRVGERAHVDRAQAHGSPQLGHQLLGLHVAAAEQEVALDRVIARGQLVGRDVMEGRHHPRVGTQDLLRFFRGGALRGRREEATAAEGERHHRAHHDFPATHVAQLGERGLETGGGHGQDHHVGGGRGLAVRLAVHPAGGR